MAGKGKRFEFRFAGPEDRAALERLSSRLAGTPYASWPSTGSGLPGAPPDDDFPVRLRRLVLYEDGEVRALQNHFEHEFHLRGVPVAFVWPNASLSESVIDPRFGLHGLALLQHGLAQCPFQAALAYLSLDAGPGRLFDRMGWVHEEVPLFLRPVHAHRVLRELPAFRFGTARQFLAGTLAASGLADAVRDLAYRVRGAVRPGSRLEVTDETEFGDWADEVWVEHAPKYEGVTRRDAATLNRLYRPGDTRFRRLRLRRGGHDVGWVVTCRNRMDDPNTYGRLVVGCLVDAFADPCDARDVLMAGTARLEQEGVDLVCGYWSHQAWDRGSRRLGFFRQSVGFRFFVSPAGQEHLLTGRRTLSTLHLTRGDCDGPGRYAPDEGAQVEGRAT